MEKRNKDAGFSTLAPLDCFSTKNVVQPKSVRETDI